MAEEITFRGYKIQASSFQNNDGKWVPQAAIIPIDEAANQEEAPLTFERDFDTQLEADDYALDSAQLYIDSNY